MENGIRHALYDVDVVVDEVITSDIRRVQLVALVGVLPFDDILGKLKKSIEKDD